MLLSLQHLSLDTIGIIGNLTLLVAISLKTPPSFKSYAVILLNSALADTLAVCIDAFLLQRLIIVPPTLAYLSHGTCSLISDRLCFVCYSGFITYLPHSVIMLAISFSYRYLVLVRPQVAPSRLHLLMFTVLIPSVLIMVLISETQAPREVIIAALKSANRDLDSDVVTGHIHYSEPKLIAAIVLICLVPSVAYTFIFIARRAVLRRLQQEVGCMSAASRRNHRTMIKASTYHACVPCVYAVGCVLFLLLFYGLIAAEPLEIACSIIPTTIPCVNPVLTLYFITPYRSLQETDTMAAIPPVFLANSWESAGEEGVDEYYKAKGAPWLVRKGMLAVSHTITWKDLGGGEYCADHKALGNVNISYYEFRLGEEFIGKRFDNENYKILMTVEKNSIIESYEKVGSSEPNEVYTFEVVGEQMKQTMKRAEASCTMTFNKK